MNMPEEHLYDLSKVSLFETDIIKLFKIRYQIQVRLIIMFIIHYLSFITIFAK